MAARSESLDTSGRELVISREFHAPVAAVWKAWTDAAQLANWWGPKEMKLEVLKADIRAGGCFHYAMKSPGHTMFGLSIYRELVAPSRLVWVNSFADEKGNVARAFFSKDFPLEVLNTVTLTEKGARTLLNLRSAPINATPAERAFFEGMFKSMEQGYGGTLDQLAKHLAGVGSSREQQGTRPKAHRGKAEALKPQLNTDDRR